MDEPTTIDFETEKIESRPFYPPKPVGVAIRHPGGREEYYAWGHRNSVTGSTSGMGNNCDVGKAAAVLRGIYRDRTAKLFHNGSFDIDVADVHLGLRAPANIEDSLFIAFLKNPHEKTIALKPLGEKYLDMPPEEQEDLRDWILDNVRQPNGKKITKKKEWGAYISNAPVDMVGPYAIGDVARTYKFWNKFRPEIIRRGMFDAYQREIKLMPITLEMERSGVRVDLSGLKKAYQVFSEMDRTLIRAIHKKLGIGGRTGADAGDFNINSGAQLAAALVKADKLSAIVRTPTGKMSTKVSVLHETCNDKELLDLLSIHSVADNYLSGFLRPWIEQAELTDGRVLPKFNQVRAKTGDGGGGTRTGRYSSSDPNLQTVTADVDESKNKDVLLLMQKYLREYYQYDFIGLRDFFLPDEGCILAAIDYNQQELRLLAHFEEGLLAEAYRTNPNLDIHEYLRQEIYKVTGTLYERKSIKILVFGLVYGMGITKLAISLKSTRQVADAIKKALMRVVPGIENLMKQLRYLADHDLPLRTWGGREYFCEDPFKMPDGKIITFEYKMLNQLIQPSAADVTKQGMINVAEQVPRVRIALQVHDELICMIPDKSYGPKITHAMCDMEFAVPMTANAKYSTKSWARVK
jgi:DNA polymerase-1